MIDTDIDARLTENARRWRDARLAGPALADVLADVGVSGTGFTDGTVRKPRRTWSGGGGRQLLALAAVAVVVAAVVLVGVVIRSQRDDGPRPAALPTAHPGDVSYLGITVTVPASWPVAPALCHTPTVDAVVPDTREAAACPARPQANVSATNTLVFLAPLTDMSDEVVHIATSKTTVDGVAALRGQGTDRRGTSLPRAVTVLVIASLGVGVEIAAVHPALADHILGTVRITPVDQYGCRARVSSLTPTGNAETAKLLAGRPASGYVCEYVAAPFDGRSGPINAPWKEPFLAGSARLSPARLASVVTGLNRFRPRSSQQSGDELSTPEVWFVLRWPDGTTRTIATTLDQVPVLAYDGHRVYSGSSDIALPTPFDR